jgi:probable F420-dependent oxidoreductase
VKFALNIPLVKVTTDGAGSAGRQVRVLVRALEQAGLDACLTSEHPAPSAHWLHNDPGGHDCTDPLTAFAYVAACSESLQLFTNIVVLPYRNPFILAKAAATLQVLSDNRLLLGVGVGYQKEEFDALGVPFKERGALADEAIETLREIWAGGAITKKGRHFDAPGNESRPVPTPPPPIWVGGGSDAALARAARLGDGWAPYFLVPTNDPDVRRSAVVDMQHFGEKAARLHELRAQHGRTGPFDMAVAPPFRPKEPTKENAEKFLGEVAELEAHGVNWIWTSIPSHDTGFYLEMVAWFGEEVIGKWRKP